MGNSKSRLYFLLILLLTTATLAFFILRPFLYALVLAVVFAIICQPIYRFVLKVCKNQESLASFVTILLVFAFIFIPLFLLGWQIFQEGQLLYFSLSDNFSNTSLAGLSSLLDQKLTSLLPVFGNLSLDLSQYFKTSLNFLLNNLGAVFFNLAKIFTELFVFLFALYYLFKDGDKIKRALIKLSPLNKEDDEIIIKKTLLAINAVIRGSLVLAVIQGLLVVVGFALFSVPNPVLWGTVAAICSLIPAIGTAIVILPAVLFLYFGGQIISATGLLLWGVLFVGLVDNLLRPYLVGRGVSLHPLLVLLSVLGGLSFFGPVGFILGPLVATLLLVLLDICSTFITKNTC